MAKDLNVSGDEKGISEFFSQHEGKASSKIYQNLASDPVISDLSNKKQFTYRETLILVSTVVGALDEKIESLERQAGNWSQIKSSINSPLIGSGNRDSNGGEPAPDQNETNWFLKYLTLRNVLGVLVVVLSMSAGFFSFINKDYRALIQAEEAKAEKYAEELVSVKSENEDLTLELKELQIVKENIESRLVSADDQITELESKLESARTKVDQSQVQSATQQADLNSQLIVQTNRADQLERQYNEEVLDRKKWEDIAKQKETTLAQRSSEFQDLERQLYSKKQELDQLINTWNQLLVYLGGKASGRFSPSIEVKVSNLNDHIDDVIEATGKLNGMRSKIPTE